MMGTAHAVIGAAMGTLAALATGQQDQMIILACAGAGAALIPDIDHARAPLRQRMGWAGNLALFWLKHRGPTHTLLAWALFTLAARFLVGDVGMVAAVSLGYLSHLVADMLTPMGLCVLWPVVSQPLWLLPRPLRLPTNGVMERLLTFGLMAGLMWVHAPYVAYLSDFLRGLLK